jgi:hypothetical protein
MSVTFSFLEPEFDHDGITQRYLLAMRQISSDSKWITVPVIVFTV